MLFLVLVFVLLVVGLTLVGMELWQFSLKSRCPECRRWWARQTIDDEFLGMFKKSEYTGSRDRRYVLRGYEKYRVYHRCKYCGHEWTSTKVVRQ